MGMERGTGGMGAGCADFIRDRFGYRRCRAFSSVVSVVALLCLGNPVQRVAAAEWSQFRGWNSSGVMETSSLPVRFGPHRNLVWRASTAPGRSSPILTREHIFLSAVEGEQLWVICLDRSSGDLQWKREVPRPRSEVMHRANGPASPTPVTDGSNVYAFFSEFGLISFDRKAGSAGACPWGPSTTPWGWPPLPFWPTARS